MQGLIYRCTATVRIVLLSMNTARFERQEGEQTTNLTEGFWREEVTSFVL